MNEAASDIVVVGGGMAGIVAGARAADLGLSVTLLERGTDEHYACNARWSGGVLHVAYTDITSPPEALRAVIDRSTKSQADAAQAEAIAANAGRLVQWLGEKGATWVGTKVDWQQFILEPMRAMRAGLDWQGRGPDVTMGRLAALIRKTGGRIVLGARARSLTMSGDRCTGVQAEIGGKRQVYPARAVVLADGGFQANFERLGRHIARHPDRVKQRGAANGTGDGLEMAEAVGAAVVGLDRFYGHILSRDAFGNDNVWPYPELDALATSGVLVGRDGCRLTDEGLGGIAVTNALARSEDPLGATIIFDAAIWEGPGRSARIPANPTLEAAGGTVLKAPTLNALALRAGLPAAALTATVASYNAAIASGGLDRLQPPRTSGRYKALPIVEAPFHAIPACAGITYTMGGIRVDGQSRVLRADGLVIEGLYAAGSNTGGLEGHGDVAYMGGLAKAGIQGLVAAESIAAGGKPARR
ncbi:MAG: FAD-binding protein [Hyphomicrobiaceae bacterium]|nr:FAD-binding protein [Hyphomicrobiaceae bacterium]